MTFTTGKGKKSKTTSIRIKPIIEPKKEEEPEVIVAEKSRSHKKRKSGKHDLQPLPPLDIPPDSNVTVKEEGGIKLKLILSPKDGNQTATVEAISEDPSPSTEEKKKSKKDKGKKGKDKGKKEKDKEEPKEEGIKAKIVFKDQVLSLDGDKVTHSEPVKSKSSSRSKKRKHDEAEDVESPSAEQQGKKKKTDKLEELDEEVVPDASPKLDKKSKKKKTDLKDTVAKLEERLDMPVVLEEIEVKSGKSKSHKDRDRHKSKDKVKEEPKEVELLRSDKKDKKKKKSKHEKSKADFLTPSRSDLDVSQTSLDSFEDTDTSLIIDEAPVESKHHSSSSKKKIKKDGDRRESSEGERMKDSERRKEKERSKHKHHRHDKHHRSDKKSKHKKHRSSDGHSVDQIRFPLGSPIIASPNSSDASFNDLTTINTSGLGIAGKSPDGSADGKAAKKSSSSSSKSKKSVKRESGEHKEKGKGKDPDRVS